MLVFSFSVSFSSFLHTLFVVSTQLFYSFEVGLGSNIFVVQFRQLFAFYVLDVYFEDSFFASQVFNKVIFREGYFYVSGIAFGQANQLIFEAGDEGVGANFQRIAFAFAAAERFAVNGTSKVDDSEVAFFNYSAFFSNYHFSVAAHHVFNLSVNLLVGYFNFFFLYMQTFVFAQFRFRFQGYFNGQFHIFAFFEGRFFNFRIGYRDQFFLVQSFAVCFVSNDFKSFLFYSFFAIVHFDNSARSFAFTEARDICLVSNFLYSLFIACVYLSSRSGNF